MAERVVDILESVEIDEEHRSAAAAAPVTALLHLLDSVQDQRPVGQPGKRVAGRESLQRVASRAELGDVVGGHNQPVYGRIVEQVDNAQLAGNGETAVAASQVDL